MTNPEVYVLVVSNHGALQFLCIDELGICKSVLQTVLTNCIYCFDDFEGFILSSAVLLSLLAEIFNKMCELVLESIVLLVVSFDLCGTNLK